MHMGDRIKQERERLGFNQTDFAVLVDASRKTLFNWESGTAAPNAVVLAAWAAHGLDVLYVLTGKRSDQFPATDAAEQVLLDSYRRCGNEGKQHLIQTAALLAAGVGAGGTPASSRKPASIKVSSKHGHAAGRDVNVNSEETHGKRHKP